MNTLFPLEPILPNGFAYLPDFIDKTEEATLFKEIEGLALHVFNFKGFEAKRKVASFGYDWNFEQQQLSKGKDIPHAFLPLIKKAATHLSINEADFAELLVTEYPIGSVINWHRDAPPFDTIAGISLCSDCIFRLRPYDKKRQVRNAILSLPVQRRSLYIMQGEARQDWEHSTKPVTAKRYSITLRTLRR